MPSETENLTVDDALRIIRKDYWDDVRGVTHDVLDQLKTWHEEGQEGEQLRESMLEYIHETIDGCGRVIYTLQAQLGLLTTENSGAYVDDFGPDGMVEDGEIQWSRLMFAAMERDVYEELDAEGLDVNDPAAFFEDSEDEEEDA